MQQDDRIVIGEELNADIGPAETIRARPEPVAARHRDARLEARTVQRALLISQYTCSPTGEPSVAAIGPLTRR